MDQPQVSEEVDASKRPPLVCEGIKECSHSPKDSYLGHSAVDCYNYLKIHLVLCVAPAADLRLPRSRAM